MMAFSIEWRFGHQIASLYFTEVQSVTLVRPERKRYHTTQVRRKIKLLEQTSTCTKADRLTQLLDRLRKHLRRFPVRPDLMVPMVVFDHPVKAPEQQHKRKKQKLTTIDNSKGESKQRINPFTSKIPSIEVFLKYVHDSDKSKEVAFIYFLTRTLKFSL